MKTSWTAITEEDKDGELIMTFPPEMMEQMDWRAGDTLSFSEKDGSILVKNLSWEARTYPSDN